VRCNEGGVLRGENLRNLYCSRIDLCFVQIETEDNNTGFFIYFTFTV
jgi:hypothetical protein